MIKNNIIHTRTCIYRISYHILWKMKCERLEKGVEEYLKSILIETSKEKLFTIFAINIKEEYVEIFVSAHPKIAPSYIVKMLKGISGRKLIIKYPELKNQLWSNEFFIETIGEITETSIKDL